MPLNQRAVYTDSEARYTDNPDGIFVEQAVEQSAQLGISAMQGNWEASARARYLGPYAMVADNSRRADSLTTLSLRGAYHWNSLTVYAEVINVLDSDGKDISYYYPAYVAGLDPAGLSSDDIDCALVSVTNSRTLPNSSQQVRVKANAESFYFRVSRNACSEMRMAGIDFLRKAANDA